jgi:hypothetical protein
MPDRAPSSTSSPQYHPRYDRSYAVVIGIDSYQHSSLFPLSKAEEDALSIQETLSAKPYNFQVDLLLGSNATRQSITGALNNLIKASQPDDRLIFYFAGHGYAHPDLHGFEIGYLACADTDPGNPFDGLEYHEVLKLTRFAKAKHIAFILDACFSGTALGLTRASMPKAAVDEYLLHTAYQVLTAGGAEVVSDARSMTGDLVKALRDGIPDQSDPLTFNRLGQHIHEVIHSRSKGRQSPICNYLEGSSKGQMVLFIPSPLDRLSSTLRKGLTHPDPLTRLFAIDAAEKSLSNPDLSAQVRSVLEDMQVDDDDRDVRRRAGQALRSHPQTVVNPEPKAPTQQPASASEIPKAKPEPPQKAASQPPAGDPILDLLPPPFEWCAIPAGRVTIENNAGTFDVQPFKMAKYPTTYAQFQVFIDASDGFKDSRWWQGLAQREEKPQEQKWKIAKHPREMVSWYTAVAFCRWLSHRVGCEVRLPTEWEWQWAAQGPDGRKYPWGNEYIQGNANINEIESKIKGGVYLMQTTPVDHYPQGASPFGVIDMVGNVWEWCLNEYGKPTNIALSGNAARVVRGGSWNYLREFARCAYRLRNFPADFSYLLGFRVVLSLANPAS